MSKAAVKAFSEHLWYLNEVLDSLAFFDHNICLAIKRDMVNALDLEGAEDLAKRIEIDKVLYSTEEKTVAIFVTQSSRRFFEILNLPTVNRVFGS